MDIRRFLAELRGRGVYRVAALYAAGSWALLQVADVMFPIIGLPDWTIVTVLIVAALGFPVALVLAWIFDLTASGLVEANKAAVDYGRLQLSTARLVELGLLLALVGLVGFLYLERLSSLESPAEVAAEDSARANRPSVAVMAFENMSDDPSAEYFGDGLAEEILNLLAQLTELDVAARTSSFYYKGKQVDLREVGRKLNVNHVLEGSVRRSGNRVRVTAQLIEMDSGFHVWSETFDRDYLDIFQIQDQIAMQVVSTMQVILSEGSRAILDDRPSVDPQAYDYYLQGRQYLRKSLSPESLDSAIALFDKALLLDNNYADAYAGLCESHLGFYNLELDSRHFELARSACETALSITPQALSIYVALGNLYTTSGRYAEAVALFEKALEINPRSADALDGLGNTYSLNQQPDLAEQTLIKAIEVQPGHWRGYMKMGAFLFQEGRFGEAIPYYRRITELMPDNAHVFSDLGAAHFLHGNFDRASEALRQSLELEPTALGYSNAGTALFYARQYSQAADMFIKAVEYAPEDFHGWGSLGDAYKYVEGKQGLAPPMYRNAIKLANKRLEVNPTDSETMGLLAHYHANLGERPEALTFLARAAELATGDMYTYYNAATALCALGDMDEAAAALAKAVDLGYSKRMIAVDANLCTLVERPEFRLDARDA